MTFSFGKRSHEKLDGIHPDLYQLCLLAIASSEVDFAILEGFRSPDRQRDLVAAGASKTQQSKHLIGHAVDVGAVVPGGISWDWHHYPRIARAFQIASRELAIHVVWGAVWDRQLAGLTDDLDAEVAAYKGRRNGKAFLDGGHFELRIDTGLDARPVMPST